MLRSNLELNGARNPVLLCLIMASCSLIGYSCAARGTVADEASVLKPAFVSSGQTGRLSVVDSFKSAVLGNVRELYIYLPPSYDKDATRRYPVLYVQDGKGAFFLSDWSKESLKLQDAADGLISAGRIEEIIIVGVANGGAERASEYAHWDGIDFGKPVQGRGGEFERFFLNELMPYIELEYRVKPGRDTTGLMGASLGGLLSLNIALSNPERFSKLALQSPYLGWGAGKLFERLDEARLEALRDIKLWLDMGSAETEFLATARRFIGLLKESGFEQPADFLFHEAPGGIHTEGSWAERADDILLYLYGNGH